MKLCHRDHDASLVICTLYFTEHSLRRPSASFARVFLVILLSAVTRLSTRGRSHSRKRTRHWDGRRPAQAQLWCEWQWLLAKVSHEVGHEVKFFISHSRAIDLLAEKSSPWNRGAFLRQVLKPPAPSQTSVALLALQFRSYVGLRIREFDLTSG